MKTKVFCLVFVLAISSFTVIFGQGFDQPAEGKAAIYFVSSTKKLIAFEFFYNDKFIGELQKLNYMRYECEPGQQLFWASSESKEFLEAYLEAGKSYIVKVELRTGFWRVNPKFTPINGSDEFFPKAAEMIKEKAPYNIPESEIQSHQSELSDFIANILDHYQNEWRQLNKYSVITPDMAIPEEAMK